MIKRFICHYKNWNNWRKYNRNNIMHKIRVFFKPKISPTFMETKEYYISLSSGKIVSWHDEYISAINGAVEMEDSGV